MAKTKTEIIGNKIKITLIIGSESQVIYIPLPKILTNRDNHTLYIDGQLKEEYKVGESLDLSGAKFLIRNSEKEVLEITNPTYELINDAKMDQVGDQNVTLSYIATCMIPIRIIQEEIIGGIEIQDQPMKTEYYLGDTFDPTGLRVRIVYVNSDRIAFVPISDLIFEGFDSSKVNPNLEVTVTYKTGDQEFKGVISVSIVKKPDDPETLNDIISIKAHVEDNTYYMHEKLVKTDIEIFGITGNGTEIPIPSQYCIFSGFDTSRATTSTPNRVDVSYTNSQGDVFTTSFNIYVMDMRRYLIGFRIDQEPSKKIYSLNSTDVDLQGGKFSARYRIREDIQDSKWIPIMKDYVSAMIDSTSYTEGDTATVTVSYGNYSQTYNVTISELEDDD